MEKNEQELAIKFKIFENQIISIQQQIQSIEQAILDISSINENLGEIKKDKEIFSPVGRGIFIKAKIISEELLVGINEKNYVKKSISETKDLIEKQIKKLDGVKKELNNALENLNKELEIILQDYQTKKNQNS